MVYVPAMPSMALVDSCNEVPFNVTLNRLAVPFSVLVPVKVAVPAEALKVPLTLRDEAIEKLAVVVVLPVSDSPLKLMVPAPEMVLDVPLIVTWPPLAVMLPLTDRLPVILKLVLLLMEPETVRLSNTIPEPVMVFVLPDKVVVPPVE